MSYLHIHFSVAFVFIGNINYDIGISDIVKDYYFIP